MASGPDPLAGDGAFGVTFRDPEGQEQGRWRWWRSRPWLSSPPPLSSARLPLTSGVCEEPPLFDTEGSGFLILPRVCVMG